MRCSRAYSLSGYLPNTQISEIQAMYHTWNHSIYQTEQQIEVIADRLRKGIIQEETANAKRLPLEAANLLLFFGKKFEP